MNTVHIEIAPATTAAWSPFEQAMRACISIEDSHYREAAVHGVITSYVMAELKVNRVPDNEAGRAWIKRRFDELGDYAKRNGVLP